MSPKGPFKNLLAPRIIVCLDVKNGRVVKGVNFNRLVDMGDPVEMAIDYQRQGADELVFLDISASVDNKKTALDRVKMVAKNLSIPFTVGGGLRSLEDVKAFLDAGADKVALNTTAILNPEIIDETAKVYGRQSIVVAIDVVKANNKLSIYSHGGNQLTQKKLFEWSKEVADRGAGEILLTAMHKDGVGSGFEIPLTTALSQNLSIQVIASGGAKTAQHFFDAFANNVDACLAAGMFHRKNTTVKNVKQFLYEQGIPVRYIP